MIVSRWLWTLITAHIARPIQYEDQATPERDLSIETVSNALEEDVVSFDQFPVEMKSPLDIDHEKDFHGVYRASYQVIISETICRCKER